MNSEKKQDMIFRIKDIRDELEISILLIEHEMKILIFHLHMLQQG